MFTGWCSWHAIHHAARVHVQETRTVQEPIHATSRRTLTAHITPLTRLLLRLSVYKLLCSSPIVFSRSHDYVTENKVKRLCI